jgi:hypothetical protein
VSATARALRLDYYALKRRVEEPVAGPARRRRPAFVEVQPTTASGVVVEIADGRGATMRVRLVGDDVAKLADLARVVLAR